MEIRTIKFRAKDITNNWCYGQLIIGNNYDFIITESDYDEVVASLSTLVCQCHPIKKGNESIGQFTGLQDKNGKDIYEGDIISSNYYPFIDDNKQNYVGVIEYIPELISFQYILYCVNPDKNGISNGINEQLEANENLILEEFEVIGNIYDNPELLREV